MRQPLTPQDFFAALRGEETIDTAPDIERGETAVRDRVVDRLLDIILIGDELFSFLQEEEASPLLWIEPHVERLLREADTLLSRLAN